MNAVAGGVRARRGPGRSPAVVAISGPSGSGKTRLLRRLIPALARRGVACAIVKHTRHPHAFDRPGKDTEVLRRAGAVAAAISGPEELAFFGPAVGGLDALVGLLPAVPLVLAEGFREEAVPRIEVHRRSVSREFLCARDPRVFAIVTDEPPPRPIPAFAPDDAEPVAALLCARLALAGARRAPARLRARPPVRRVPPESGRTIAPRERGPMAKTRSRKGGARGRRGGATRKRSGSAGGKATLKARGPEFYSEIGRKGGKRSAQSRRRRGGSRSSARRGRAKTSRPRGSRASGSSRRGARASR